MLIGTQNIEFGRSCQPNSVGDIKYRIRMVEKDPKLILWENTKALMLERYGKENLGRLAVDAGFAPANTTRLKQAKTSMGMDHVAAVARALKVELWQLFVDGLVANDLPTLTTPLNGWPFQDLAPERFHGLSDMQKAKIEGALLNMVSQFENASQSSAVAAKVKTPIDRSGLRSGTPKRVQTTPQDLKSLRETKRDVSINRLSGKGKAGRGVNKKA